MENKKITQTAGRDGLGDFAPNFAHFNDDILFGEQWNDESISTKTKCIVTMTSLISSGIVDSSLKYHLINAKGSGVTREEIAAIISHIAFYAGWPKAWAAFRLAKEVWTEETAVDEKDGFQQNIMFPIGEKNEAYAKYFKGQSYLSLLSPKTGMCNVTFEPGCRNNWHIHHAKTGGGQLLVCVGGRGYYQEYGKPAVEMTEGTIIEIPADVKHWHGAAKDSWFAHLAMEIPGTEPLTEWREEVTDEEYEAANKDK
ncbi:MAG: carboxymuconolactone decarboxylase family protein [Clostridia bacterium]|nr:carboxymuconolactone decarboxylase family protein [Clostridia bacterium]